MTADVITLGECLISLIATSPGPLAEAISFERHVAGAEANVAVGLARLGYSVAYVGRIGADGFGTAIAKTLRGEGVDVAHLRVDDGATTGLMVRERRVLGAAHVIYARSGSAGSRLSIDDVDRAAADGCFAGARWLHVSGITPALSASAHEAARHAVGLGRTAGLTVSFDVNLRRRLWSDAAAAPIVSAFAELADVVFGSPDELAVLTGSATADPEALARAVLDLGPTVAVVKLGSEGALALERRGTPVTSAAIHVPAVLDPVGAGDGFCAGFIAGRLEGTDIATALRHANACGAAAVAAVGDLTGLPNAAELAGLLADEGPDTIR
jgi:2-dehydro-3-deoxygluconokinase